MTNDELKCVFGGIVSLLSIAASSSVVAASERNLKEEWCETQLENIKKLSNELTRLLGFDYEIGGSND